MNDYHVYVAFVDHPIIHELVVASSEASAKRTARKLAMARRPFAIVCDVSVEKVTMNPRMF